MEQEPGFLGIRGLVPGTHNWRVFWKQHPDRQEEMLKFAETFHYGEKKVSLADRQKAAREKLEEFIDALKKLSDKHYIVSFIIDLAQIIYDHEVTVREGGGRCLTVQIDGFDFTIDEEDLLDFFGGMDTETLGLTIVQDEKRHA